MTQVRKAVITAAGKGTRQYPATNTVQKELFPLVDVDGYTKPTLQIIVEEALASGIEEVCIVANTANVDAIRRHFEMPSAQARAALKGKEWALGLADKLADMGERLTFVVQAVQDGYGHAVLQARDWVGDEPHVLMLGDHVYIGHGERCCRQAVDVYNRHQLPEATVSILDESVLHPVWHCPRRADSRRAKCHQNHGHDRETDDRGGAPKFAQPRAQSGQVPLLFWDSRIPA